MNKLALLYYALSQICDIFMWKLRCYKDDRGKCGVREKYESTVGIEAGFDASWAHLSKLDKESWQRPHVAKLSKASKGEFRDYYEIRFKADNVQQRPIGYFGPKKDEFTILIWVIEKGGKFVPHSWRKKADSARKAIESGGERYVEDFEID